MIIQTLQIKGRPLPPVTATPLTREAFAPFGSVVSNPAPDSLPHNTPPPAVAATLPCDAKSANQGSAIQYRDLGAVRNLYPAAAAATGSATPATPRLTMFVSGARELREAGGDGGENGEEKGGGSGGGFFEVKILERHPFTTQTFCPLGVDPSSTRRYVVIVAPSIPPPSSSSTSSPDTVFDSADSNDDAFLPGGGEEGKGEGRNGPDLLKRGWPDLRGLRAFVAAGNQAVTYGAGTWHAPMVVLGPAGSAIDFVVTQFANGVDVEDCQEVVLRRKRNDDGSNRGGSGGSSSSRDSTRSGGEGEDHDDSSGIWVRIPAAADDDNHNKSATLSKL